MSLSKPLKAIVGIATAIWILLPLLGMGIVALAIITGSAYEAQGAGVPRFIQAAQGTWLAAICLVILLQYPLIAFYVAHIVMNSSANDVAKVDHGVGSLLCPLYRHAVLLSRICPPHQPTSLGIEASTTRRDGLMPIPLAHFPSSRRSGPPNNSLKLTRRAALSGPLARPLAGRTILVSLARFRRAA